LHISNNFHILAHRRKYGLSKIPITYYIDWTGLEDFKSYTFDKKGIPQVNNIASPGLYYNPITIAQYGLYTLGQWERSGDKSTKMLAFECGDWFVQNGKQYKFDSIVWPYNFNLNFYNRKAPWISAMAQGEAISLLLRLHNLQNTNNYESIAKQAINVFLENVSKGGVVDWLDKDSALFQEYPSEPSSHVLNGHVFALLGVWDYAQYFQDNNMHELVQRGLNSLYKYWQKWDTSFWTRYDLFRPQRLASPMYHELHIRQFQTLARIFEKPELSNVAAIWQKYQKSPVARARWLCGKTKEKWDLRGKLN
jgi:heparosan-N-sulfate-glucuronate 5-epimerase